MQQHALKAFSAAILAVSLAGAAAASITPADLAPAFGNTIVSTHPDGRKAKLWLNPDRTWSAMGRKGQKSSGTWRLKDDKLCLSQRQPFTGPFAFCRPLPRVKVGQAWPDTAVNGDHVVNRVVRGR